MMKIKPEVLAPAGDPECLNAALMFGADAVYLAKKSFGMRSAPDNFSHEDLISACRKAHALGRKIYLTCNTLPRNRELSDLKEFAADAEEAGVDAYIVSDIGVMSLLKEYTPDIAVHISTQAGVVNYASAREFYRMGAERVVLARELSLDEIKAIRDNTPPELEIETFVHGAMCVSFSGRCLLSQYLTGRDANRGECAQPCRWSYSLMEKTRSGEYFPIFEDDGGTYILNAKDLCMIEYLDELSAAGVSSFKIEGRAKSSYYVSVVTNAYRSAVDFLSENPQKMLPDWIKNEVYKVSHREYSTGFFYPDNPPSQNFNDGGYIRNYDVAGIVESYEDGFITIRQRNRFFRGDMLEALIPGREPFEISADEILDSSGKHAESANKAYEIYKIKSSHQLPKGAILRLRKGE